MSGLLRKSAIITGASSGIGAAIARKFAAQGAKLTLVGRSDLALGRVADECAQLAGKGGEEPTVIRADFLQPADIASLVSSYLAKNHSLDVLVNNAGILELGDIHNVTMEQFDRIMQVNLRSVVELTRHLVPALVKAQGNIVNISSVNGVRSFPGLQAYNISKAALDQFTRCTALELASMNVRVNSVNPGVIITELQKRGGLSEEKYEAFLEHAKTTHALGRPGEPDEIAEAVLFLGDNARASFITGVSLPVDGGRHAMCPR